MGYLNPARCLLNRLSVVVRSPALDKRHPKDAESSQVVHPYASCRTERYGWSNATHTVSAGKPACHCRSLGSRCRLSCGGLLLHLLVALPQVEDLGVGLRVDLVHGVPGGPPRLS